MSGGVSESSESSVMVWLGGVLPTVGLSGLQPPFMGARVLSFSPGPGVAGPSVVVVVRALFIPVAP